MTAPRSLTLSEETRRHPSRRFVRPPSAGPGIRSAPAAGAPAFLFGASTIADARGAALPALAGGPPGLAQPPAENETQTTARRRNRTAWFIGGDSEMGSWFDEWP